MRLSVHLVGALALAAALPLAAAGWLLTTTGRAALEAQVRAAQLASAEHVAEGADRWLSDTLARITLYLDAFEPAELDEEALTGALRLLYRQLEEADAIALFDGAGRQVVAPVRLTDTDSAPGRRPVDDAELATFLSRVPVQAARAEGMAVGEAYPASRKHAMMLPVAVHLGGAAAGWVLGVELALLPMQRLVGRESRGDVGQALLLDAAGTVLAHPDGAQLGRALGSATPPAERPAVASREADGERLLVATAPLGTVAWSARVERPEEEAFAAVTDLERRFAWILGVALISVGGLGLVLARAIAGPVRRVAAQARVLAGGTSRAGAAGPRLGGTGPAEVRELSEAFQTMQEALARSRERLEGFNAELQSRIAARTAELSRAQAELLQSRKLAALGELGAGVAHELNNPLTGILGMAQLLLRRHADGDPDHAALRRIEADARRCRDVTHNLLRFSEQGTSAVLEPTDANEVVRSALALHGALIEDRGLVLRAHLDPDLPPVRADAGQLQQVLHNLLSNATTATSPGGRIEVKTRRDGAFVQLVVADTGHGIASENLERVFEPFFTTKRDWRGAGLGLSVAWQIVQAHHGTLTVASRLDEGSRFTVSLPAGDALERAS